MVPPERGWAIARAAPFTPALGIFEISHARTPCKKGAIARPFRGWPALKQYAAAETERMGLDQIGIAFSGVIAVWLTQDKRESRRRWACIFGMLGQPFWFYAAWKAEQWGIFALCTLYTYAWARGLWAHWLRPYLTAGERHTPAAASWFTSAKAPSLAPHSRLR
jgi:hypothetical protein